MSISSVSIFLASTVSQTHPNQSLIIPRVSQIRRHNFSWSKALLVILWPLATDTFSRVPRFVESFSQVPALKFARMGVTPIGVRSSSKATSLTRKNTMDEPPDVQSPWKLFPSWQYNLLVKKHGADRVKLIYMVRHAEGTHNVNRDFKSIEQLDARLTPFGIQQCRELRDELLLVKNGTTDKKCREEADTASRNGWKYHTQGLDRLMENLKETRSHEDKANIDGHKDNDTCVVVSPLTRCIQTAMYSFEFFTQVTTTTGKEQDYSSTNDNTKVPFLGIEALRETVNYNCDRRRRISEVANEFPEIDFTHCHSNEDEIWLSYRGREKDQEGRERTFVDGTLLEGAKKNYLESAQLYAVANRGRNAMEFIQSLPQSKIVVCTHSAYLRCILNWGQTGGVPKMFDQRLDDREDPTRQDKLFEYCFEQNESIDQSSESIKDQISQFDQASFEKYMREDYGNAELRSFCLLVQQA